MTRNLRAVIPSVRSDHADECVINMMVIELRGQSVESKHDICTLLDESLKG